jgi:hypothetical protein
LLLECTGICNGAWVIASVHKKIAGFKYDEVYIGTAEERAAMQKADKEQNLSLGHMYTASMANPKKMNADEIAEAEHDLKEQQAEIQARLADLAKRKAAMTSGKDVESGTEAED